MVRAKIIKLNVNVLVKILLFSRICMIE